MVGCSRWQHGEEPSLLPRALEECWKTAVGQFPGMDPHLHVLLLPAPATWRSMRRQADCRLFFAALARRWGSDAGWGMLRSLALACWTLGGSVSELTLRFCIVEDTQGPHRLCWSCSTSVPFWDGTGVSGENYREAAKMLPLKMEGSACLARGPSLPLPCYFRPSAFGSRG